jgi:hypothetical protein
MGPCTPSNSVIVALDLGILQARKPVQPAVGHTFTYRKDFRFEQSE